MLEKDVRVVAAFRQRLRERLADQLVRHAEAREVADPFGLPGFCEHGRQVKKIRDSNGCECSGSGTEYGSPGKAWVVGHA